KQGQSEYLDIFSQLLSLRNQRNELLKFLKLLEGGQISKEKNYVATALNGMAEVYKDSENKPKVDAEVKIEIEKMLIQNPEEKTKQSIRDLIKIISE
ncbi:MAG: hypothetical protein KDF60_20210, partial [Calditrichaeota bacterium]|nr:hypothetical protein [Calditrichota bacterium]